MPYLRKFGTRDESREYYLRRLQRAYVREIITMQDNLKNKYGITSEQLKRAVDQIPFGKIACDGAVLIALVDLVCNGDIAPEE